MEALLADDDHNLVAELRYAALNLGARPFVREVASALTELVGSAWERGQLQIRHEHVLTDALVTQLRVMWAAGGGPARGERILLATFPGEQHSLGLEMAGAYLASLGITPRSMGPSVPAEEIAEAARAFDVAAVAISASRGSEVGATQLHLNDLARSAGGKFPIAVGGALGSRLTLPQGVQVIANWDAFERWVALVCGDACSGFGSVRPDGDRSSS
jgi:methanogenic corrinoid protein MtbC1